MPFNQLQSPENIIKAEVLLVALVKGLGLDAAGKPPLPTGHTISLQVGQLLCSAVWDASTRVWRTSSILYHGSGNFGAALAPDQARPLLCLLEPPELRVTCPAPSSESGNCSSVATLKLLLQHVPLLAFVEQGGVPAGLPSNMAAAAALQQQQQQQTGSAIDPSQGISSSRSIPGSLNEAGAATAAREGSTGSSSTATGTSSSMPVPGSEGSPDPSRSGQQANSTTAPTAKEAAGQWRLRMSYAGRELPSAVINNVAFVTEDHFPVQVLVVELEVNLHPLCHLVVPGGPYTQQATSSMGQFADAAAAQAGRYQSAADQLTVMLTLELLMQDVPVAQLRLPAVVTGLARDGFAQGRGGSNTVSTGGGSGAGYQQADGRYEPNATTQFAADGQHHRRRLMGQQMPFPVPEHISQHSAGSSTTHQSYVTVASNPSDALPSPVHGPEFTSTRSSAPANANHLAAAGTMQQNVQHGLILLQSISTRDDASSGMNSRNTMASAAVQSGTAAVPPAPMFVQPWPIEDGARPVGERQEEGPCDYFEEVQADPGKAAAVQQSMPGEVQKLAPAAVQQSVPGAVQKPVAAAVQQLEPDKVSLPALARDSAQTRFSLASTSATQQASELHLDATPTGRNNATQFMSPAAAPDLAINAHQLMLGSASPHNSPDLMPLTDASSSGSSAYPSPNLADQLHAGDSSNDISAPAHASHVVPVAPVAGSPRKGQQRTVYRTRHERLGPSKLGMSMQRAQDKDSCGDEVEDQCFSEGQSAIGADLEVGEHMRGTSTARVAAEADNAVALVSVRTSEVDGVAQQIQEPQSMISPFARVLASSQVATGDAAAVGSAGYHADPQESAGQEQMQPKVLEHYTMSQDPPLPQHLRTMQLSQSPSKGCGQRHGSTVLESVDACSEYLSATSSLAGR